MEMESILMNFVNGFLNTSIGFDVIWIIVDRLTKLTHFISIRIGFPLQKLNEIYIVMIVKLHGILSSIVSDRGSRFTFGFGESLQQALGTKLNLSSAYHP